MQAVNEPTIKARLITLEDPSHTFLDLVLETPWWGRNELTYRHQQIDGQAHRQMIAGGRETGVANATSIG